MSASFAGCLSSLGRQASNPSVAALSSATGHFRIAFRFHCQYAVFTSMKKPPLHFFPLCLLLCLLTGAAFGQGITRLEDINLQPPPDRDPAHLETDRIVNVNGTLFIATEDTLSGPELFKSDGTLAGTVLVKDVVAGIEGSNPANLVAVGSGAAARPFFTLSIRDHDTSQTNTNLWTTDGTPAGTVMVKDFKAGGSTSRDPGKFLSIGSTLFFEGYDPAAGMELWKCGLNGQTALVKNINPGTSSADISDLLSYNGTLYFAANDGSDVKMWRSD